MPRYRSTPRPQTLGECLNAYTVPNLRKLAGLLSSDLPTRKAELIEVIQKPMEDDESLRQIWERLDELQQAAVSEAVHAPDARLDATRFRAKYGRNPDWGTWRYSDIEKASLLSFFIYNSEVPRDLKERLLAFVPSPPPVEIQTVEMLPETITQTWKDYDYTSRKTKVVTDEILLIRCDTERAAQHDLQAVMRLIDTGKVRASDRTRQVASTGAKAIAEVLYGGDFYPPDEEPDEDTTAAGPIKAFALPLLLQSAGLANLSGSTLQLTPAGKKAINEPPHRVLRTVWQRWLQTTLLDEFNRVNAIKGQTGKGGRKMTAAKGRRAAIVKALKECPPDRWIAFDEFSRFMVASGHTFEVTHDPWTLYIADSHYGSLGYSGFHDWHILQGRYILTFLFEYAATLGLIDVAYIHPAGARSDYGGLWGTDGLDYLSRYDGLMYFRVNALGAWCLGLADKYVPSAPEESQILQVLPTLEVVATEPLPPGDVLFLEQFAEKISDVVWKIQPTLLLKALEEGRSVAEMEKFLTAKSGRGLPDNVSVFFKDMTERASRLTERGAALLIEAADGIFAQLIVNDSRLRSLCMLAGDRYIVVPAESESAFRRALRELGYGLPVRRE